MTFKTIDTVISVNNHGPCYLCHVTLLKDYYRVDMSMCRYIMSCFMKCVTMFGHFMLVFLRCAFRLFSSVAFLLRSFSFPSVFLIGISDQIRSVVSLGVGVLGCGDTTVNVS